MAIIAGGAAVAARRPTPGAKPAAQSPTVPLPDFRNMTYPAGACGPGTQSFTVSHSNWAPPFEADVQAGGGIAVSDVRTAELDSRPGLEAIVLLQCAKAMTDHHGSVAVFSARDQKYALIATAQPTRGMTDTDSFDSTPLTLRTEGRVLRVLYATYTRWDANCCPSGLVWVTSRLRGTRLIAENQGVVAARSAPDPTSPWNPDMVVLRGLAGGLNVTAAASTQAIHSLEALDLTSAQFPSPPTCTQQPDLITRCKIIVVVAGKRHVITMDSGNGDAPVEVSGDNGQVTIGSSTYEVFGGNGQAERGASAYIVQSVSIDQ